MFENKKYVLSSIRLEGDAEFVQKTVTALKLIEQSSEDANFVKTYIGIIRQSEKSGIWVRETPPVFCVGKATYTASSTWYASAIVHDACHSYLFQKGEVHSGREAEDTCMLRQIAFLRAIGGPAHEISYLESLIQNKVDYFSDYRSRNW